MGLFPFIVLAFLTPHSEESFLAIHRCTVPNSIRGYAESCRERRALDAAVPATKRRALENTGHACQIRLLPQLLLQRNRVACLAYEVGEKLRRLLLLFFTKLLESGIAAQRIPERIEPKKRRSNRVLPVNVAIVRRM